MHMVALQGRLDPGRHHPAHGRDHRTSRTTRPSTTSSPVTANAERQRGRRGRAVPGRRERQRPGGHRHAPYALSWDSRTVANGAHTLTARARDAAGNTTTSAPVNVNVTNTDYFQNESSRPASTCRPRSSSCRTGACSSASCRARSRSCRRRTPSRIPALFLQITNIGSAGVQQGIYDIALDPSFATNHFYYVFYTLGSPNHDRVSRFTANATLTGTVAGSEFVLYEDPQTPTRSTTAGR